MGRDEDIDSATGQGSMTASESPSAWMSANIGTLGGRQLRHLCMPGSHDAGMSQISGGTPFASARNTQTQTGGVLEQLLCGSRYFDIRPVISGGQYLTGHYQQVRLPIIGTTTMQGANGQSIESIINDVNAYLARNQEFVVLYLSHDMDTDAGNSNYPPFNQDQWEGLLGELLRLEHLFLPAIRGLDLTRQTLNQLIGSKPAVVVIVDPGDAGIILGSYEARGFYHPISFFMFNEYSDSNDLATMEQDQLAKLARQRSDPDASYFLLSWTLTQSKKQATLPGTASILDLAATANRALYAEVLPACTAQTYPNIVYIDAMNDPRIIDLVMAINTRAQG